MIECHPGQVLQDAAPGSPRPEPSLDLNRRGAEIPTLRCAPVGMTKGESL
jgi:hypothetical protein